MSTCQTCRFLLDGGNDLYLDVRKHAYYCVRFPPTVIPPMMVGNGQVAMMKAVYPLIEAGDVACGEYRLRQVSQ